MNTLESTEQHPKVVVVGAGSVGATYCYALAQSGLASEIVLGAWCRNLLTLSVIARSPAGRGKLCDEVILLSLQQINFCPRRSGVSLLRSSTFYFRLPSSVFRLPSQ